ncbi:NAD-dependent epimerase/dehydratase family protein [Scatolibacter rhodanostii]|uniref:NAD-dependent epimerase/dehydratase family protein n=1 Tax=Scatolibacter rhodanostii TaxID=2014781 RepID=UPI000C078240|nr:NAD(P)-dependent oxidoreductase [Scatolibacter rhodanostii]
MKSAVVTGANGFIGRALTKELLQQGVRVLAVTRIHNDTEESPNLIPVTLDLAELSRLPELTEERWDVFYHLAWSGTSGEGRKDVNRQLFNVEATVEAVQVAKLLGCSRFIGAGSIMEQEMLAASAEPQIRPGKGYIYSAAKLAAHQMSRCAAAELEIEHIWAVITNVYGEGEYSPRLLNSTLRKIIRDEELNFTAATQNYDFLHIDDAVRAMRLLGERGVPFSAYTIGSGKVRPLRDFIQELCLTVAPHKTPVFGKVSFEGGSLSANAFDTTPLHTDTGFIPEISFREGVERTMKWIQESME